MTVHPSILERVGTGLFVGGIRSLSTLAGGVRIPLLVLPPPGGAVMMGCLVRTLCTTSGLSGSFERDHDATLRAVLQHCVDCTFDRVEIEWDDVGDRHLDVVLDRSGQGFVDDAAWGFFAEDVALGTETCGDDAPQDVAKHLGVCWGTIKDIQKRYLSKRYARPKLKNIDRIAIDEISIGKGHRYLTVVLNLKTGAVIFVGDGKV